jgi:hypothetical protein
VYSSAGVSALVPPGVVTVTPTVPVPGGLVTVTVVALTTVSPLPRWVPKWTAVAPVRSVPLTVRCLPLRPTPAPDLSR